MKIIIHNIILSKEDDAVKFDCDDKSVRESFR